MRQPNLVVWTLPLSARLHQRSLGRKARAAFLAKTGELVVSGVEDSMRKALARAEALVVESGGMLYRYIPEPTQ